MQCPRPFILLGCVLLTACTSPPPVPTPTIQTVRLPTRLPTPTPTTTPFALSAQDYWQRGQERQRAGDLVWAQRYFTWAIQTDPGFAPAYVSRGTLHLAEGNPERALRDADAALEIEPLAAAYRLRAEALRRLARYQDALRAFDGALARDAGLRDDTFLSRWRAAQALADEERLVELSAEYAVAHPGDPLRHYYQAWATLQSDAYDQVIDALVDDMEEPSEQLAVLWYVLGRAYIGIEAWSEAAVSLEAARGLVEAGDASLTVHTEQPVADLFVALGRAYLGAGRCADAETMLAYGMSAGASMEKHLAALEEARACQASDESGATPTP